jgi:hypothetical protein
MDELLKMTSIHSKETIQHRITFVSPPKKLKSYTTYTEELYNLRSEENIIED